MKIRGKGKKKERKKNQRKYKCSYRYINMV